MRNLLEYPITELEVLDFLESINHDPQVDGIGGLKGVIRNMLINYYEQYPEALTKIVANSTIKR